MSSEHIDTLFGSLDRLVTAFEFGAFEVAAECFFKTLPSVREALPLDEWYAAIDQVARAHEVFECIQQDPFSKYACAKPRGYAGDALLLEFLYRGEMVAPLCAEASHAGNRVCEIFMTSPAAAAVRARRNILADAIDRIGACAGRGRVLSVACGHVREASHSVALRNQQVELVGIDQDLISIETARQDIAAAGLSASVTLLNSSIGPVLKRTLDLGRFNLIYAAGLFDYLSTAIAQKLCSALFDMLEPGGALIVTNFLKSNVNAATMELFQDWRLIHRDRIEIEELASRIPRDAISECGYSEDFHKCIGYSRVTRAT